MFHKAGFVILSSSYRDDVFSRVYLSDMCGFKQLLDAMKSRWNIMIDSWTAAPTAQLCFQQNANISMLSVSWRYLHADVRRYNVYEVYYIGLVC